MREPQARRPAIRKIPCSVQWKTQGRERILRSPVGSSSRFTFATSFVGMMAWWSLTSEKPPKLYDLTTLQREANRIYGYTAQQTLDYIQLLYEKKGVVVADFGIAYHLRRLHRAIKTGRKRKCRRYRLAECRQVRRHILCQITGIRARICGQFFLI